MERFVIIVNDWKPLSIITKRSIVDVAAALDPPLLLCFGIKTKIYCLNSTECMNLFIVAYRTI